MPELIRIAIPAHDEREWLPATLADLEAQTDPDFAVWICVNQPSDHAGNPLFARSDRANRETVAWLEATRFPFPVNLTVALDPPSAPSPELAGVGWARRVLFERMTEGADEGAICVSLDADTRIGVDYVAAIRDVFARHPNGVALAVPYYHPLPEDEALSRRILDYEIYLRYYQISLWRIGSPYAFLPIGSGMAFRAGAYRRVGGIEPRQAGEDFYFMQKLRKLGPVIRHVEARIEPSARRSSRNPFGTGATLDNDDRLTIDDRYPLYDQRSFDALAKTFDLFGELFTREVPLPIDEYLETRLGGRVPFARMRRNHTDRGRFVRACHERFDALRTLQFLRFDRGGVTPDDSASLVALLARIGVAHPQIDLSAATLSQRASIRSLLWRVETHLQRQFMTAWDPSARW